MTSKAIQVVAIDDHPLIRAGIKAQILDDPQIELVAEGSVGDDVLVLAAAHCPDVMLLDIKMPQSHDQERGEFRIMPLLPILQRRHPDMAIIIVSQYASQTLLSGAIDRGVRGYLLKDDAMTLELPEAIRRVASGSLYFSRGISERLLMNQQGPASLPTRLTEALFSLVENPNFTFAEHASQLNISEGTFKNYALDLRSRMGVENNIALVIEALRRGIVSLPT